MSLNYEKKLKEKHMAKYYVNDRAQSTGEHEVHKEGCPFLPLVVSKTYLGEHSSCQLALIEAKKYYNNVDGCATCCRNCHTR